MAEIELKRCPFCGERKIELDKPDLLFSSARFQKSSRFGCVEHSTTYCGRGLPEC